MKINVSSLKYSSLAVLIALGGCASQPAQDVADATVDAAKEATMNAAKETLPLYNRLGGQDAIVAVVDDFVANVAADKRVNEFFAKTDIPNLKAMLVDQICSATGGPCVYSGRDMKTTHAGMGVTEEHFNAVVEDLVTTLDKFKVPETEKNELLGILGPMKSDIVTK